MKKAELYKNILKEMELTNKRNAIINAGLVAFENLYQKYKKQLEELKDGNEKIKRRAS